MALTNYAAARPWAKAIRDQILSRRMPPWGAVPGVREFAGDPSLLQPEIDMLAGWVEGGAPEGDAADLPAHLPVFKTQSPALPRYTCTVTVTAETTLTKAGSLVAIGAKDVPAGGSLEAWAVEPDGTVERLLWIKDSRHTRQYTLLTPLALPAGTRVRVAATGGHVILYLGGRV